MKTCSAEGCADVVLARQMCRRHYGRWRWANRTPEQIEKERAYRKRYGKKRYAANREHVLRHQQEKYATDPAFRARRAAQYQRRKQNDPEGERRRVRHYTAKKYGLTLEQYDQIMARGCALCGKTEGRMHLDHCHLTGTVRDCLCHGCNTALGKFGDDPARLRAAADYIEQHRS